MRLCTQLLFMLLLHGCSLPVIAAAAPADIRLHCIGQGSPVFLVGGGPAFTTWNLQPVQQHLADRYRVCRWDMRGVGDNAKAGLPPGEAVLSQWLRDMREVLPPEPVILWGHSWGALQVLLFARQSPERVRRLVLSNPVDPALLSLATIENKRFNHPEDDSRLRLEDMDSPVEQRYILRSKIASYFADAQQGWEYAAGFTQDDSNKAMNIQVWDEYRDNPLTDADVRRLAGKIGGLVYCRDDVLQPENMDEYRRLLGESRHLVLAQCAHFPWEENPAAYYRALMFLMHD